jgi:hypothetical protein
MRTLFATLLLLSPLTPPDEPALAPWGSKGQASDVAKKHVEELTAGRHAYTVKQGGTMDGTNCRTPVGVGMSDRVIEYTWESNRAVRLENVGETTLVNPWLSNGRNNVRSMDEVVASAVTPDMSPKDKAMAIWWQHINRRFHFPAGGNQGQGGESHDPVKVYNIYGSNTCGEDSMMMAGLWKKAGMKAAPCRLTTHCVSQVFYDGRWHVLDGDMHSMFLLRDNETVAGEQDLVRDHDLIKRSHTQGIMNHANRGSDEWLSAIYLYEGEVRGDRDCWQSTFTMALRPREALTWRWGHTTPMKYRGANPHNCPEMVCNGLWEYKPDFTKDLWKKGADSVDGVRLDGNALAAETGKTGTIVWTMKSPYVYVGGKIEAVGAGATFELSWDGKTWAAVGPDLDKLFTSDAPPRYQYQLRCKLDGAAKLQSLRIVNDLQMAALGMPSMKIGANEFVYTDQTTGARKVKITHEWVERSSSKPPDAPASAVYPTDQGTAKGTDIVFKWAPAKDPDGDKVTDYQFELSNRADLRWPLSMNFYRLISRTADKGKAQYTLPYVGLLNPDQTYYWRVRAKDDKGVWGAWSKIWTFKAQAPAMPVDVKLDGTVLRWKSGTAGRKPAKYRVYGSEEKGFTASDDPYPVGIGSSKGLPSPFPANFIAEVKGTELEVLGGEYSTKAFYRVVAIDEEGVRSGSSDYVAAPRPYFFSKPVTKAKVHTEYRYGAAASRSIGDYRTRNANGQTISAFHDIEEVRFSLEKGPAWLKIDEKTGVLTGIPDGPGNVEVVLKATIDAVDRKVDEMTLSWGNEKVVSEGTRNVGSATQKFTLEVTP